MKKELIEQVVRQLGGREYFEDIVNHGADCGYTGFTYYSDTVEFYTDNRAHIVEMAEEMAEEMEEDVIAMVKGFQCLRNDYSLSDVAKALYGSITDSDEWTMIANALSWFALEEVARHETDQ